MLCMIDNRIADCTNVIESIVISNFYVISLLLMLKSVSIFVSYLLNSSFIVNNINKRVFKIGLIISYIT